jgi:hypothetical protein
MIVRFYPIAKPERIDNISPIDSQNSKLRRIKYA